MLHTAARVFKYGIVCCVQVIPSGEVATKGPDTTQKIDPFHATEAQLEKDGNVRAVHVIPSGEVAATEVN
jgi:hypothetical protein